MTLNHQHTVFEQFVSMMRTTILKKGDDYATEDRLSNFKMAGAIAGGTPQLNCLNLIATKVARLGVLLNSDKSPQNESVQDSILDLANYAVLLYMIMQEVPSKYYEVSVPHLSQQEVQQNLTRANRISELESNMKELLNPVDQH